MATMVSADEAALAARRARSARIAARIQAFANVCWPAVAFATVGSHAARLGVPEFSDMGLVGGLVVGLIPMTLVGFMQLAGGASVPLDLRGWALGLVAPVVVGVLASGAAGLGWVAFEIGALYLAALLTAYAWIVWVRPFRSGRYRAMPASERRFYVGAAALQGLLLVPGAVALGVFGIVLVAGADRSVWALSAYAVAWIGLTSHEIRWMNAAAWP